MNYIHTDIFSLQKPKKTGNPCGDVIGFRRDIDATTIILADGLGSGIKANIAAEMCVSRFLALVEQGASLREAFSALVKTMNSAWGRHNSFSVFSVARILNNGNTTILSYDSPLPLFVASNYAKILSDRTYTIENAVINECSTRLSIGESILLMSDGISQAGLGNGMNNGWESKGVAQYINKSIKLESLSPNLLLEKIFNQANSYWGKSRGDDCSLLLAKNRKGITVNLLSGTPKDKNTDNQLVNDFSNSIGIKIICGGTTAKIAAREMKKQLEADTSNPNSISPPSYKIDGINLVTEGIITLNQVYNLLEEDDICTDEDSPVYELLDFLKMTDRVKIFTGKSNNLANKSIIFKQQGIIQRQKILQLIKDKLVEMGKLVVVLEY